MENFKIIIFILAVLISLSAVIDKLKLPNPVFLVLVGLIIGFVPVLPGLVMDPDVVFLVFYLPCCMMQLSAPRGMILKPI
jgi:monovalent cation/hydrogen antiporter